MISTGHMTVGSIANNLLSATTKNTINQMLECNLDFPDISANPYANPTPSELAAKLNTLMLTAGWADGIKAYTWTNIQLGYNYSDLHFLDTAIYINQTYTPEEIDNLVLQAIGDATTMNVVNAINSAIKTLCNAVNADTELEGQEALVALRCLVHYLGDIVQPYHVADPLFLCSDGSVIDTYGGNNIYIVQGEDLDTISFQRYSPSGGQYFSDASEFHLFWDACCGIFQQVPEPYNQSFEQFGVASWYGVKGLGGGLMDSYVKYIDSLGETLVTEYNNNVDPTQQQSAKAWAQESGQLAYNFLDEESKGLKIISQNGVVKLLFSNLPEYQKEAKSIIGTQVCRGGYRLAQILHAIFDPSEAPQTFQKMVQDINDSNEIVTLDELVNGSNPRLLQTNRRRCFKSTFDHLTSSST